MAATMTTSAGGALGNKPDTKLAEKLARGPGKAGMLGFLVVLVIGLVYAASQLIRCRS